MRMLTTNQALKGHTTIRVNSSCRYQPFVWALTSDLVCSSRTVSSFPTVICFTGFVRWIKTKLKLKTLGDGKASWKRLEKPRKTYLGNWRLRRLFGMEPIVERRMGYQTMRSGQTWQNITQESSLSDRHRCTLTKLMRCSLITAATPMRLFVTSSSGSKIISQTASLPSQITCTTNTWSRMAGPSHGF